MLNEVILETRVVKNNGLKFSNKGNPYLGLTFVFDTLERKGNEWNTKGNFIKGTLIGKKAQKLSEHLKPGSAVIVRGKLNQRKWETAEGQKKFDFDLTIDELYFQKVRRPKLQG